MNLRKIGTWYKLHKWTAIVTGVLILIWLISGVVMTVPSLVRGIMADHGRQTLGQPDFVAAVISPSAAIAELEQSLETPVDVAKIDMLRVGRDLVYRIDLLDGSTYLIDSATGARADMTVDRAQELAAAVVNSGAPITEFEYITRHDVNYIYGPLPAYRIVFDDEKNTHIYIAAEDGAILRSSRLTRIFTLVESFHSFAILRVIVGDRKSLINGLLWTSIVVTIFAALFGYYLSLPHRRRPRRTL